jgi:hypothetical protein
MKTWPMSDGLSMVQTKCSRFVEVVLPRYLRRGAPFQPLDISLHGPLC